MQNRKWCPRFHHVIYAAATAIFVAGALFPQKINAFVQVQKQPLAVDSIVPLGSVPAGKTTMRQISLFNPHLSTVTLKKASTTYGCMVVQKAATVIAPLRHGSITIAVSPNRLGQGSETVDLETSHGSQQVVIEYEAT